MTSLTSHQASVLRYIRQYQWAERRSPSVLTVALHLDVNGFAAFKTIRCLMDKGAIEKSGDGMILFPREALSAEFSQPFL